MNVVGEFGHESFESLSAVKQLIFFVRRRTIHVSPEHVAYMSGSCQKEHSDGIRCSYHLR